MDDPSSIFLPAKPRRPRKRTQAAASATPVAPTLVAAAFAVDEVGSFVTLTFDVAVAVPAFEVSELFVEQQVLEGTYVPTGASLVDAVTVRVELAFASPWPAGPDVLLSASAATGIVAAADAELAWAGVEGLELPFP